MVVSLKSARNSKSKTNASSKAQVAEALAGFLASTYTLYQKSLYYHWNVSGPEFNSLHAMFMTHYTELQTAIDELAERIRALGFTAPGTLAGFVNMSAIQEDKKLPTTSQMISNLLDAHRICASEAKQVHDIADAGEDEVTKDLMIGRMTVHDKTAWMLNMLTQ